MEFRNGDDAAMGVEQNIAGNTLDAPVRRQTETKAVSMDTKDMASDALVAQASAGALAEVAKAAKSAGDSDSKTIQARRFTVQSPMPRAMRCSPISARKR